MHACPACQRNTIPLYRALISRATPVPVACSHCQTQVRRQRRRADVVAYAPAMLTWCAAHPLTLFPGPVAPMLFLIFAYAMSVIAGVAMWLHTVRYEIIEVEDAFTPHTRELRP